MKNKHITTRFPFMADYPPEETYQHILVGGFSPPLWKI
jgi:hypothetical protein